MLCTKHSCMPHPHESNWKALSAKLLKVCTTLNRVLTPMHILSLYSISSGTLVVLYDIVGSTSRTHGSTTCNKHQCCTCNKNTTLSWGLSCKQSCDHFLQLSGCVMTAHVITTWTWMFYSSLTIYKLSTVSNHFDWCTWWHGWQIMTELNGRQW